MEKAPISSNSKLDSLILHCDLHMQINRRRRILVGSHMGQSTELDPELLSTKSRMIKTNKQQNKNHTTPNHNQQNVLSITKIPMRTGRLKDIYSHWSPHCFILESIGVSVVTMGKQFLSGQEWFLLLSYPTFYSKRENSLHCYISSDVTSILRKPGWNLPCWWWGRSLNRSA